MNFIKQTYQINAHTNKKLALFIGFAFLLVFSRILLTHSLMYGFLIWNLFLAFVPYYLLQIVQLKVNLLENILYRIAIFIGWLLFLPNAFYVITDFVHLKYTSVHLFWYDLVLIGVFALVSFSFGILALKEGIKMAKLFYSEKIISFTLPLLCFLCGFGIYLGRVLRFNSWEIITNPLQLLHTIFETLVQPEALLFSIIYGLLIYLVNLVKSPI
jgi:uncharacterized membrane protein